MNTTGIVFSGGLGSQSCAAPTRGNNERHVSSNQIVRQGRQPVIIVFGPAIFNRNVIALDITGLDKTLAKTVDVRINGDRRRAVKEANHWHPRLLRAR
jgi:hypothetical protein